MTKQMSLNIQSTNPFNISLFAKQIRQDPIEMFLFNQNISIIVQPL
jgi:hypothetical protein